MSKSLSAQMQADTAYHIKNWLEKGDYQVYTILRHVSRSGMFRVIQLVTFVDNEPVFMGYSVAKLLGYNYDSDREGIKVSGTGMDMGYHLVNSLSSFLYRNEDGSYSHDGAYKLRHRWL